MSETENNPAPEPTIYRGIKDGAELYTETVTLGTEQPAAARLRAFEDEHLGEDAVRFNEQVERGHGSAYARLSPAKHKQYEALEKLVATEQKLADAHTALMQADADHEAAMAELAAAENEPDADPAA